MPRPKRPHRVAGRQARARLLTTGREELPVLDLSLGGACLALEEVLPGRERVRLELRHPHLAAPAALRAEVVWSRRAAEGSPARAGLRFLELTAPQRLALRRCMLAEHGHAVIAEDGAVAGYLVQTGPAAWGCFDREVRRVAELLREEDGLFLAREGSKAKVPSVIAAAGRAFGLTSPPQLDPAVELGEPELQGSAVHAHGAHVGYVASTGETTWSFFDPQREPLGFMTRDEGLWRVVLLGSSDDGALELRRADSYPAALAAAFRLAAPPELRTAVFRPAHRLEAF